MLKIITILITGFIFMLNFSIVYATEIRQNNNSKNSVEYILEQNNNKHKDLAFLEYKFGEDYGDPLVAYTLYNAYLNNEDIDYIQAANVLYKYCFSENRKDMEVKQHRDLQNKFNVYKTQSKILNKADTAAILSGLYLYFNDEENAFIQVQEAYKLNPEKYASLIANYYKAQNDNQMALKYYYEAISKNPYDYNSMLNAAEILLFTNNKPQEALQYCIKLINAKSNYYQASALAFNCMTRLKYSDKQIIDILSPQDANISYVDAYLKIAQEFISNYKYVAAKKIYYHIIELYPNNANIYLTAAENFINVKKYDAATDFLEKVSNISMTNSDYIRYTILFSILNSFNKEE